MPGKKGLIYLLVLIMVFLAITYGLFPGKQVTGGSVALAANYNAAIRELPDTLTWKKWWPWAETGKKGNHSEGTLRLKGVSDTQLALEWEESGISVPLQVTLSSRGNDSTLLVWSATWEVGANPFSRIREFARSRRLGNDVNTFLRAFSVYASNPENVYGFKPVFTKVTDTLLISTKSIFYAPPGTTELYQLIGNLETFAGQKGAPVTGQPMYHVTPSGKGYEMMVALPIGKLITASGNFRIKRMVDGHLLTAEVKAGPETLKVLSNQFEQYKNDYQLASPAIPYLQPITNRMNNPDTSQWISRMCYPIF